MPVVGLPIAAEDILSTLLCKNTVTSWKVTGTDEGAVFVLRLRNGKDDRGFAMTPAPTGAWRRKPPAQQRRDQRRAEQHSAKVGMNRNNVQFTAQIDANHQSEENNNNQCVVNKSDLGQTRNSVHVDVSSRREARASDPSLSTPPHSTVSMLAPLNAAELSSRMNDDTPDPDSTLCINKQVSLSCVHENIDTANQSSEVGANEAPLFDILSTLPENKKTKLKSTFRNNRFEKIVCQTKGGKKTLLAESDDCILVFDCEMFKTRTYDVIPVAAETASEDMRRDMLYLRRGQQVNRVRLREEIEQLNTDLHEYVRVIRTFLETGERL